jgi:hypothetical protein
MAHQGSASPADAAQPGEPPLLFHQTGTSLPWRILGQRIVSEQLADGLARVHILQFALPHFGELNLGIPPRFHVPP